MLSHGEQIQQRIKLRAIPQQPPNLQLLGQNVVAAQGGGALCGNEVPRQHFQGCGFASAIDTQEPKAFSLWNAKR